MLQRAHVQASLLAELRDARAVVVRQLALAENRVRDVGERHQVDLQHLRLHASLLFVVLLQDVQQEAGRFADHVPLQEQIRHRVGVHRRRVLLPDLNRDLHRALRVAHQRGLQHVRVVGLMPGHLAVLAHLLELALLRERGHHLAVGLGLDVHAQRHVGVDALEQVAQLLRALQLVLRHPRVQQLLLVLRQHELRQLHRLERVELTALQADPEVLQQRRGLVGRCGHVLEPRDGLLGAQRAAGGGGELGGALEVARVEQRLELGHHERLRAGQVAPLRQGQRQLRVLELAGDERHHGLLVDVHQQHLPSPVHRVHAADAGRARRDEHRVVGNLVAVNRRRRLDVVHEQQPHLRDHVQHAVLRRGVHGDGEVVREVGREEQLRLALRERRLAGRRAQLDDVQLRGDGPVGLRGFLRKRHQLRLLRVPGDVVRGERGGVRLKRLRALLRRGVQLHVALDERRARGVAGRDAHEREPLHVLAGAVGDDLRAVQVGRAVEHLGGRGVALHGPVEHRGVRHDAQHRGPDPGPEHHALGHLVRLHLALHLDVEDLQVILRRARDGRLQGDHLRHGVHQRAVRGDGPARGRFEGGKRDAVGSVSEA